MIVETLNIDNTTVVFYDDYIEDTKLSLNGLEILFENLIQKINEL